MIDKITKLTVKYNNKIVGYLVDLGDYKIAFQYDENWLKNGFSISPFSLPLSNKIFISDKLTFDGLFGVFYDSLPDGWGELLLRRMLNKKGINFDKLSPLQKLAIISKNGLGALTYEPNRSLENKTFEFDFDKFDKESKKILNDDTKNKSLDEIYAFGGSSGGARPKAHININKEEWIIKFPCLIDPPDIGIIEYNTNKLAKECGINVNEFALFPSNICSGYFGAKRFDRDKGKRLHMISLSAILETTHKIANLDYYHLFQVIQKICKNKKENLIEAYKRMCFNVLYKNRDDHGKNFAFLYNEKLKSYVLSPAYDLTPTPNKIEHEMTVKGNPNPNESDMLELAKDFELPIFECKKIIDKIKNVTKKSQN